jgi:NADH:ubiquinone oxidoreductase subunit 6 (subunit J)
MGTIALAAAALVCAWQVVRAPRLLAAALWLAGASAVSALLLYSLGLRQAAVIELSVGAGLVFILFVFTINLAGEGRAAGSSVPRAAAAGVMGLIVALLGFLAWPRLPAVGGAPETPLSVSLWAERPFDVLVQIVLIFAGAVTIVSLLAPEPPAAATATEGQTTDAPLEQAAPAPSASPVVEAPALEEAVL